MSRLIDADELIKTLNDTSLKSDGYHVDNIINSMQTAYNVDSVVEELENFRDEHTNDDGSSWYEADLMSQMIEIVKRGGKNVEL